MTLKEKKYYFNKLKEHIGHSIEIVGYGGKTESVPYLYPTHEEIDFVNISIECIDCNKVLIDFDK